MSRISDIWSFHDTTFSLTNPVLAGSPITFAGGVGAGDMTLTMDAMQSGKEVSADGTVQPHAITDDSGRLSIRMLQGGELHSAFLALYNILNTQKKQGNSSNWAASKVSVANQVVQRKWNLKGVMFEKIGDYPFAAAGGFVTWVLIGCDIGQS